MFIVNVLFMCFVIIRGVSMAEINTSTDINNITATTHSTRRILGGRKVGDTRPYMVYLRAAVGADPKIADTDWICGGTIIHERYILTSAACIEDAKHFYVVSGTHQWVRAGDKSNECINNGAKKAIWKCVPKAYFYDGDDFDNIRWMVGDIAVVKVEDDFNFERRVRGCDFIPKKVMFNNRSLDMEKAGTLGSIAGWGATDKFGDVINRPPVNSPDLLETDVVLISKKACKKRWDKRYHFIIEDHMVCTKDTADEESMNSLCAEHEVNCKEMTYSTEDSEEESRRQLVVDPNQLSVDTAAHIDARKKGHRMPTGGFCENDHGGPLIVGQGKSSIVVGVMSACLSKDITHKCYGPFLYTSVYKYRNMITCALDKEMGITCRRLLRSSKTTFDWSIHPDGPPKNNDHHEDDTMDEPSKPLIPRSALSTAGRLGSKLKFIS